MIYDAIAFNTTNHTMPQIYESFEKYFSRYTPNLNLLKFIIDPEKYILSSSLQWGFLNYLTNVPQFYILKIKVQILSRLGGSLVVILVALCKEEVPLAQHGCQTSPLQCVVYDFKVSLGFCSWPV